jgi:toxin CptA
MSSAVVFQHPVKPSLRFALSLLALHMMAAAAVFVTALPWPAKLAMLLLIILSLAYYLARDVLLLLPDSWRDISLDRKDVSVVTSRGTVLTGHVANSTLVSPYLVILCVKPEGQRLLVSRVIFPDAISARAFREFCVHLRFAE